LKTNQIRFGEAIALEEGVKKKAQAQGETIDSALLSTPKNFHVSVPRNLL
jgi:hypothetical protein